MRFLIALLLCVSLPAAVAGCAARAPLADRQSADEDQAAYEEAQRQRSQYSAFLREMGEIDRNYKVYYNYSMARRAVDQRDFQTARRCYEAAAQIADPAEFPYVELAEVCLNLGDLECATQQIEAALRANPDNLDAWVAKAGLAEGSGDPEAALQSYQSCLSIDPRNVECRLFKAELLTGLARYDEAFVELERLLQIQPDDLQTHMLMARVCMASGREQRAQTELTAILETEPENMAALLGLGLLADEAGRKEQALERYQQALAVDPGNGELRERVIMLLLELGRPAEALQEAERIRSLDGDERGWRLTRALVLLHMGELDQAAQAATEALEQNPQDDYARLLLGNVLIKQHRGEQALEQLEQIGPRSEYFTRALSTRAEALRMLERWDAAIEVAQAGRQIDPSDDYWLRSEAISLAGLKRFDESQKLLEQGLAAAPRNTDLLYTLALVQHEAGRLPQAVRTIKRVLRIDPQHVSALNFLGYSYAEQGIKLERAERLLLEADRLRPDDGYIADSLGWVYFQRGEHQRAAAQLERAVRLAPDEPEIFNHLGDAYRALGRIEEAASAYQRALDSKPDPELRQQLQRKLEQLGQGTGK